MNWEPGDSFIIKVSDETAEHRSLDDFKKMIEAIRTVVNVFDFDIEQWGGEEAFRKYYKMTEPLSEEHQKTIQKRIEKAENE